MQASGTLQDLQTGASRRFQTDADGKFALGDLGFGRYRLELSGQGFATRSLLVDVPSNNPVTRTITMALGVESARVDVIAATPLGGSNLSLQEMPGPVQTATGQDLNNSGSLDLSKGVYCFAAVGNAGRHFRIHGRRTAEPAVWRCGELGFDPSHRDL